MVFSDLLFNFNVELLLIEYNDDLGSKLYCEIAISFYFVAVNEDFSKYVKLWCAEEKLPHKLTCWISIRVKHRGWETQTEKRLFNCKNES